MDDPGSVFKLMYLHKRITDAGLGISEAMAGPPACLVIKTSASNELAESAAEYSPLERSRLCELVITQAKQGLFGLFL